MLNRYRRQFFSFACRVFVTASYKSLNKLLRTMKAMEGSTKHFFESLLSNDDRKSDAKRASLPAIVQRVHCPTCGSYAERYHQENSVKTQCSHCDYLMTICTETGRVIEAYAPSFSPASFAAMAA